MPGLIQPQRRVTFYPDGTATISIRSNYSGVVNTATLPITREQWDRWQGGEDIGTALAHIAADYREFLMTGMTPAEWTAMCREMEDED